MLTRCGHNRDRGDIGRWFEIMRKLCCLNTAIKTPDGVMDWTGQQPIASFDAGLVKIDVECRSLACVQRLYGVPIQANAAHPRDITTETLYKLISSAHLS